MKSLISFLFVFVYFSGHAQDDTLIFDVEELSIDFKTCECVLFHDCRSYSYPGETDRNKADSLFIENNDTVFVVLRVNGVPRIEGYKLPKDGIHGKVRFFNANSELVKIEIWEGCGLEHGGNTASWSDDLHWRRKAVYRNTQLSKETTRSIIFNEKKGFARHIEVKRYKNGVLRRTKIRNRYF